MTDASELRRLFDEIADLPEAARDAAIDGMDVDDGVRDRLRTMLAVDTEIESSGDVEPAPRTHPWPGDPVGAYRLVAPIGDGGMGSVWLAVARGAPEVDVAVKLAIPTSVSVGEARSRLEQERRVLASLDHPGIVPIVDAGETDGGIPFLVLRAIHGRTIDVYARERSLTHAEVVEIFERIAEALEHVHEHGIVHRDVKPQNVLVTDDGTPVLIDFGAARITDASALTASFLTVGASPRTPAFASPEQERGEEATAATDVYALGVTLRAALDAGGGAPTIDRRLARILDRACHQSAQRRYDSARELRDALHRWRRNVDLQKVRRRSRLRAATVTFLVILVLAQFDGESRARRDGANDPGSAELRGALLDGFGTMPAAQIPVDHEVLADLAARQGSVDWAIAALVRAVAAGEHGAARDALGGVLARIGEANPMRRVELIRVCSELGLPGPALAALRGVDLEKLSPLEQFELRVLEAMNRARTGRPPSSEQLAQLTADFHRMVTEGSHAVGSSVDEAEPQLDLDGDGVEADLSRLRLSLGDPTAVSLWLQDAGAVGWRDPRAATTEELETLLVLHLRLRTAGHVQAIAEPMLEAIEAELVWRAEEDGEPLAIRPWAAARMARVLRAMGAEPRRARELAQAGLVEVRDSGTAPLDLVVRMGAISAAAAARAGGLQQARSGFQDAAELGRIALGERSPLVMSLVKLEDDPTATAPLFDRSDIDDMPGIRRAIQREGGGRLGRPWWAP